MTRLRHFDNLGDARFVTFTCFGRRQYLTNPVARKVVLQGLDYLRNQRQVRVLGWVIMPDHLHLVLLPPDPVKLGEVIGRFKSWTAQQILSALRPAGAVKCRDDGSPAMWQRRCYDYNCRTPEAVRQKINYCHNNPVTRGLVDEPSQWPWSSCNWYRGESEVLLEIDGIEL